jgi:hypothetical protein
MKGKVEDGVKAKVKWTVCHVATISGDLGLKEDKQPSLKMYGGVEV